MSIFSRRGQRYDGIVVRANHPRFGYGNYAVRGNDNPNFRKPLNFINGQWEVA